MKLKSLSWSWTSITILLLLLLTVLIPKGYSKTILEEKEDKEDNLNSKTTSTTKHHKTTTSTTTTSTTPPPKTHHLQDNLDDNLEVIVETNINQSSIENVEDQGYYRPGSSYPSDFMPKQMRENGGIIVHIILLIYICLALGIVCDHYFLSSLEVISDELKLPPDVAGATFMAMGTSAPELFTSIIGVYISKDDIGTGTILGSAVFNIIFIPAICSFAAYFFLVKNNQNSKNQPQQFSNQVSKFSILRDSIFYLITTTVLLLVLKDNVVDWIESMAMICLFIIYLTIMYYNAKLGDYALGGAGGGVGSGSGSGTPPSLLERTNEKTPLLSVPMTTTSSTVATATAGTSTSASAAPSTLEWDNPDSFRQRSGSNNNLLLGRRRLSSMIIEEGLIEAENWTESNFLIKFLMFPAIWLFRLTIPRPCRYWFMFTFLLSIIWIILLTYLSVWMVTIIGDTFHIPETVGGLTLLAAGTSIPELISSVLVVKRAGLVDMALCNSIGSNIFDILICLGLPWFIKTLINMLDLGTLDPVITSVPIRSEGLPLTTFTLILTILALLTSLSMFEWKLSLGVGIICSLIYLIFITIASVVEILFA